MPVSLLHKPRLTQSQKKRGVAAPQLKENYTEQINSVSNINLYHRMRKLPKYEEGQLDCVRLLDNYDFPDLIENWQPERYYDKRDVLEAIKTFYTVIVLGCAGGGKTTSAIWSACQLRKEQKREVHLCTFSNHNKNELYEKYVAECKELGIPYQKKEECCHTFSEISGIGGTDFMKKVKKDSIFIIDESGFLKYGSTSAGILRIIQDKSKNCRVIFTGDIKQSSGDHFYLDFIASASNITQIIEEAGDEYYTEYLKYGIYGNYSNAVLFDHYKKCGIDRIPFVVNLKTGKNPLHTMFDNGHTGNVLNFLPYKKSDLIKYLFICRELCDSVARQFQMYEAHRYLKLFKNMAKEKPLYGDSKKGKGHGFGPIYPGMTFRITRDHIHGDFKYGDTLEFRCFVNKLGKNGRKIEEACCKNTRTGKIVYVPSSMYINIASTNCFTETEFQGSRTDAVLIHVFRKWSMTADIELTANTRSYRKTLFVCLDKKDNDTPLSIYGCSKYLKRIHDRPKLSDKIDNAYEEKVIRKNYEKSSKNGPAPEEGYVLHNMYEEALKNGDKKKRREIHKEIERRLSFATSAKKVKEIKKNTENRMENIDSSIFQPGNTVRVSSAWKLADGISGQMSCDNDADMCVPSKYQFNQLFPLTWTNFSQMLEVCLQENFSVYAWRDYVIDYLKNTLGITVKEGKYPEKLNMLFFEGIRKYLNTLTTRHIKLRGFEEMTYGDLVVEFLSCSYKSESKYRWLKLPYLASFCLNYFRVLNTILGVEDCIKYFIELLGEFDDPNLAHSFSVCIDYFTYHGDVNRIYNATKHMKAEIVGSNRKSFSVKTITEEPVVIDKEVFDEETEEYRSVPISEEESKVITKEIVLVHTDEGGKESNTTCKNFIPVKHAGKIPSMMGYYGAISREEKEIAKIENRRPKFKPALSMQEVRKIVDRLNKRNTDPEVYYSWALDIYGTHITVVDVDGDSRAIDILEEKFKSLGIDPIKEVSPTDPNRVHYFFYCPVNIDEDIICAYKSETGYKVDLFVPTGHHLIFRKNKISYGETLPDIRDFGEILVKLIGERIR